MWYIIGGIILFIVIVVLLLYRETKLFRTTTYVFCSPKVNEKGFRVVVLADLHSKVYGRDNEPLLKAIDDAEPDMVICAGDMFTAWPDVYIDGHIGKDGELVSDHKELRQIVSFLKRLTEKYPVFYGNGNHESRLYRRREMYKDSYENVVGILKDIGVYFLANDSEQIIINDNLVQVYGLDIDGWLYRRFEKLVMPEKYITEKLGNIDDSVPSGECLNLLIAHNPDYFDNYIAWGADVTFSGHLHGGVMRLPVIGGVISPQFHLFPRYSGDIYTKDGKAVVVSKGIGEHSMPIRIFDRAEVVVLDILPTKQ